MQFSLPCEKRGLPTGQELASLLQSLRSHDRLAEARLLAALDDTVEEPGETLNVRANDLAVVLKVTLADQLPHKAETEKHGDN